MKSKTALILIILMATIIPVGALGEWLIVSIERSEDDVWMTEIGNVFGYEASVRILHDSIGIHSFIRFENLNISKNDKINYATLYVYAGFDQGEALDPGASVTIYGIDEPDCTPFSYSGRIWSLGRPYTSAYVNWDLSNWTYGWHEVNVTDIVKEIVNQYAWEGNNSLGFQILGVTDSGHEVRTFEDIDHPHHGAYAYLYIQFNDAGERPDGLPDTAEWVETYGEYDIWSVPSGVIGGYPLDPMDYVFTYIRPDSGYNVTYAYIGNESSAVNVSSANYEDATGMSTQRKIVRTNDGTLYTVYNKLWNICIKKSINNGTTWIDETILDTGTYLQDHPSIAVDSQDNLHVVWLGDPDVPSKAQIWYIKWNGTDWETPETKLSTRANMYSYDQLPPSIAIDSEGNIHVVWAGKAQGYTTRDQIWYVNYTTGWTACLRISTGGNMHNEIMSDPTITVDSNDTVHVLFVGEETEFPNYNQIWYLNNSVGLGIGTGIVIQRISTYSGMNVTVQAHPSIAMDTSDILQAVWDGGATGFANDQIWIANRSLSWGTPVRISTYTDMENYTQNNPSVALNSTDGIHVLWDGKASGYTDNETIWHNEYVESWATPDIQRVTGKNRYPNLRWSRWPQGEPSDEEFYLADENNTLVETWNGENCTSLDCIEDWVDDNTGTGTGDPLDPDPGTQGWDTEGPFTRFKMRLYFLFIGLGCLFIPLWAMAYKKFDAVGYAGCFIIMVLGVGLLWSITGI